MEADIEEVRTKNNRLEEKVLILEEENKILKRDNLQIKSRNEMGDNESQK
jgi:hypothetical protein